jgi:acetyl/propionyl-CoA carboxylase alpha subunit
VEFLLQDGKYYLLEVNTRLQVEHPVTEMVMGIDLVKAQILTAQGELVFGPQQIRTPHGHAIECRIYAENPYLGGVPSTGVLGKVHWPEGPGRRFEFGFEEGDEITSYYDPMIAKVIVWDESRPRSIQKMIRVLKDSVIFGVQTNIPYLLEILTHKEFVNGAMTTRFIETYFAEALKTPDLSEVEKLLVQKALQTSVVGAATEINMSNVSSPWQTFWRGV